MFLCVMFLYIIFLCVIFLCVIFLCVIFLCVIFLAVGSKSVFPRAHMYRPIARESTAPPLKETCVGLILQAPALQ